MAKTASIVLAVFLFALLSTGTALAAGVTGVKNIEQGKTAGVAAETLHSGKEFIGTEVRDSAGQKVGQIEDIALDFDRGIGYALVSSDEALKIDKTFLVPLSALTSSHDGKFVNLTVSREQLATMPKRDVRMTEQEYDRNLYDFYGVSYPWGDLPGNVPIERSTIPGRNLTYPGQRDVLPPKD